MQAYEKGYWRLSGYERIIREDHQNCLFDKREIYYDKPSACSSSQALVFFNGLNYMWNWNFSEVIILAPKVGSVNMYA